MGKKIKVGPIFFASFGNASSAHDLIRIRLLVVFFLFCFILKPIAFQTKGKKLKQSGSE